MPTFSNCNYAKIYVHQLFDMSLKYYMKKKNGINWNNYVQGAQNS